MRRSARARSKSNTKLVLEIPGDLYDVGNNILTKYTLVFLEEEELMTRISKETVIESTVPTTYSCNMEVVRAWQNAVEDHMSAPRGRCPSAYEEY